MRASQKLFMLTLGCVFLTCALEPAGRAQEPAKEPSKSAVFGSGHGLDHVGIAVRDLENAKKTYRQLGFAVLAGGKHPNGTRNSGPGLESGYLELITFWDRTKTEGGVVASFLEKQEGALFLGLDVSAVDDTANFLRTRGFKINGPEAGSIGPDPEQHDDDTANFGSWRLAGPESGPVPAAHLPVSSSDAIFFIQYQPLIHANTAKKLASIWMGVRDLEASVRTYESMGFHITRNLTAPQLGALAREIDAGQGTILLLQANNDPNSAVASFLANRKAEGIMGMSIEVTSLQTARTVLEASTKRQFAPYAGTYGQSILIPPELTHGVWIEFFQKASPH